MDVQFHHGDTVAVIYVDRGENRLNLEFLRQLNGALDKVERNLNVQVLITTGKGRFYSNGVDLNFFGENPDKIGKFGRELTITLRRLLTFPILTIAAINGHAFAGGMIFALSHDLRVMRTGYGWLSLNEIYLKMRITSGLLELVKSKVPHGPVEHSLLILGKRFTAEAALAAGLVNQITKQENLLTEAMNLGKDTCKAGVFDREMFHQMKCDVYKQTLDVMKSSLGNPDKATIKSQL